jgi:predicted nucleotidyltransferase
MTALATIVGDQLDLIRRLCAHHHVARLELFGSATGDRFDADASDLDFLVEFLPLAPADRADAYFGLLAALQDVFRRDVDLVEAEAVSNPYFRKAVDRQRMVLYAA